MRYKYTLTLPIMIIITIHISCSNTPKSMFDNYIRRLVSRYKEKSSGL